MLKTNIEKMRYLEMQTFIIQTTSGFVISSLSGEMTSVTTWMGENTDCWGGTLIIYLPKIKAAAWIAAASEQLKPVYTMLIKKRYNHCILTV